MTRPFADPLTTPWAQLPLALMCMVVVAMGHLYVGLAGLTVLVVAWPPLVPFRPVAVVAVLVRYLPFVLLWVAGLVGYLQLSHALGYTISPQPILQRLAAQGCNLPGFGVYAVGIVVLAPVFEEILFRGYLFTALATRLPMWGVQLVTAAAFGLVHGYDYALPIAVLALLFGYLRQKHGSLLPCILAHTVHNGLTVLLTVLWPAHLDLLYPQ